MAAHVCVSVYMFTVGQVSLAYICLWLCMIVYMCIPLYVLCARVVEALPYQGPSKPLAVPDLDLTLTKRPSWPGLLWADTAWISPNSSRMKENGLSDLKRPTGRR